jgi:SPP1 gp7 family putative phage head morphogenesis protein
MGDSSQLDILARTLDRYAEILRPWARSIAQQMLTDVSRRDEKAWASYARFMGLELKRELASADVGATLSALLDEQTTLITSLPEQAADRVRRVSVQYGASIPWQRPLTEMQLHTTHEIIISNMPRGQRADELAQELFKVMDITRNRADLIAATEIGRVATSLTKIRAQQVGSSHFTWRTARDIKVRPIHRKLEGTSWPWDSPPVAGENGEHYLPGSGPRCRCYAEPVFKNS